MGISAAVVVVALVAATVAVRSSDALLAVEAWLAEVEAEVEPAADPGAADSEPPVEADSEALLDAGAADSLVDCDVDSEPLLDAGAPDSLVASDPDTDSPADGAAADSLVDAGASDALVEAGAADSLVDSGAAASDSGAADSPALSDVASVAESLVASVLPGVSAALPSVASVLRLAWVTS